tara:strand:- start:69 stop:974 length:906 start_codon:yes stop_codon:yes gene_type:complete
MSSRVALISYNKFNYSNMTFSELDDNDRIPSQKISYPRYKVNSSEKQLYIQTPEIKLDGGGIPSENSPYHPTPKARANGVKIPLENRESTPEKLTLFRSKLEEIDAYLSSDEFKKKFFGPKNKKKYEYIPIVKTPQEIEPDSDDEENKADKKERHRPIYMKARIQVVYGSEGDDVNIDVYSEDKTKPRKDRYEEVEVTTLSELSKYMRYMSTVKFVLHPCKIWADKQPANGGKVRKYSITFKIKRVIFDKNQQMSSSIDDDLDKVVCIDSDSDEESDVDTAVKKNYMKEASADSDDESSDE